jgi:hypothetical protein
MDSLDNSTWMALGVTLSVAGLGISAVLWKRRGPAAGLRAAAWALLPLAAAMTRTLKVLWEMGELFVRYVANLVFNPLMWLGLVVLAVSVVLFVVSGMMRSRGVGTTGRPATKDGAGGSTTGTAALPAGSGRKAPAPVDDDMADIEAILRKHGIT